MAAVILDSGALIALDRGDRQIAALLHTAASEGIDAITSCACVAQAWRDPVRQARLTRALAGILERPLDSSTARRCGMLLARSRTSDIVDAAVTLLAGPADLVLTSDPDDIARLVGVTGAGARVRGV